MNELKLSVFTPSNDTQYLNEAYEFMKDGLWDEWVIVLNGGASWTPPEDDRIKIFSFESDLIGALKRFACEQCTGDVYIELDHDDIILPEAFTKLRQAIAADPDSSFFYSNCAEFEQDFQAREKYSDKYGWHYRNFKVPNQPIEKPRIIYEAVSFKPFPSAVSKIWWAPNHFRAWKKQTYWAAGGHDATMSILDDLDLMCRTARLARFHHINECFYLYRVTGNNSWLKKNAEIQEGVWPIYQKYVRGIASTWSILNGLHQVVNPKKEDFNQLLLSSDNDSFGYINLDDAVQHWQDPVKAMMNVWRVMAHGGMLFITVPSTEGRGAFQDPTHKSFWNENSFWYYTKRHYMESVGMKVGFQTSYIRTYFPTDWHRENNISYVEAHLVAVKNGERLPGQVEV